MLWFSMPLFSFLWIKSLLPQAWKVKRLIINQLTKCILPPFIFKINHGIIILHFCLISFSINSKKHKIAFAPAPYRAKKRLWNVYTAYTRAFYPPIHTLHTLYAHCNAPNSAGVWITLWKMWITFNVYAQHYAHMGTAYTVFIFRKNGLIIKKEPANRSAGPRKSEKAANCRFF